MALTCLRAPESVRGPSADALISSTVAASALLPKYGTAIDNVSAYEKLTGRSRRAPGRRPPPGRPTAGVRRRHPGPVRHRRRSAADRGRHPGPSQQPARAGPRISEPAGNRSSGHRPPAQPQATAGRRPGRCPGGALGGGLKSMAAAGNPAGREAAPRAFGNSSSRPPLPRRGDQRGGAQADALLQPRRSAIARVFYSRTSSTWRLLWGCR